MPPAMPVRYLDALMADGKTQYDGVAVVVVLHVNDGTRVEAQIVARSGAVREVLGAQFLDGLEHSAAEVDDRTDGEMRGIKRCRGFDDDRRRLTVGRRSTPGPAGRGGGRMLPRSSSAGSGIGAASACGRLNRRGGSFCCKRKRNHEMLRVTAVGRCREESRGLSSHVCYRRLHFM
jgi:hypothetical protein